MHIQFNDVLRNMQQQLELSQAVDDVLLIELVNQIRPSDSKNIDEIEQKFQQFIQILLLTPHAAITLQSFLLRLINQYKQTSLFADTGILSLDGFWNQLAQRVGAHFLPLIHDGTQLQELVRRVFHQPNDQYWLDQISEKNWQQLFQLLNQGHSNQKEKLKIKHELIKAITVISYRISGIGLYPEFIDAQPELTEYESPFLEQNREIIEFIQHYKKLHQNRD